MSFCKKCNNILDPAKDIIKKPEKWEIDGARCNQCGYLYYPKHKETFFEKTWQKDFAEQREKILSSSYELLDVNKKEVYRLFFFLDSLTKYINYYFTDEIFSDHHLLIDSLKEIGATKAVAVAEQVTDLYHRQAAINARFFPGSEAIDDEWEDITFSLYQAIDVDIEERIFNRYLKI